MSSLALGEDLTVTDSVRYAQQSVSGVCGRYSWALLRYQSRYGHPFSALPSSSTFRLAVVVDHPVLRDGFDRTTESASPRSAAGHRWFEKGR